MDGVLKYAGVRIWTELKRLLYLSLHFTVYYSASRVNLSKSLVIQ